MEQLLNFVHFGQIFDDTDDVQRTVGFVADDAGRDFDGCYRAILTQATFFPSVRGGRFIRQIFNGA